MIWFASDHHFGHAALLTFTKDDGSHARPGFRDVDHMNETMIANHNRVVGQTDSVYFLGDVGFGKTTLAAVLPRLNGKKRLILGNHDYSDRQMIRFYLEHFQKIMSWRHFTEPDCALICTHYPLHEFELSWALRWQLRECPWSHPRSTHQRSTLHQRLRRADQLHARQLRLAGCESEEGNGVKIHYVPAPRQAAPQGRHPAVGILRNVGVAQSFDFIGGPDRI